MILNFVRVVAFRIFGLENTSCYSASKSSTDSHSSGAAGGGSEAGLGDEAGGKQWAAGREGVLDWTKSG